MSYKQKTKYHVTTNSPSYCSKKWNRKHLTSSGLDFAANPYNPKDINNTSELLEYFEKCLADGGSSKEIYRSRPATRMDLNNGEVIYLAASKYEIIRMAYCQIVHHRAQMGVYLG